MLTWRLAAKIDAEIDGTNDPQRRSIWKKRYGILISRLIQRYIYHIYIYKYKYRL